MPLDGPTDLRFKVPGGQLLTHPNRDTRLPYLYEVPQSTHPLAKDRDAIARVLVYVNDASRATLEAKHAFEKTLSVPLGPDSNMLDNGLFELTDGTIVYARPLGEKTANLDIAVMWVADGVTFFKDEPKILEQLKAARDAILGEEEESNLGNLGTYFERLGQKGVGDTRCYSLSITHQHSRSLVGPTAGSKVYEDTPSENVRLRQQVIGINTQVAMRVLEAFGPQDLLNNLQRNADMNNVPSVGSWNNYAFPAVQLNLAPAVSYSTCRTEGLDVAMGQFGATAGHLDALDSVGGMTAMIANSRLPEGYENGRFHILILGCYVRLSPCTVVTFCGLMRHGGTPPIAPPESKVAKHAYRMMVVGYPPHSILSGSGIHVIPFASFSKGQLLKLGPEITSHHQNSTPIPLTNEANWAQDGLAFMDPFAHATFMGRGMLQLCHYIASQIDGFEIDGDKFLESMSIPANGKDDAGEGFEISEGGECSERSEKDNKRICLRPWEGAPDRSSKRYAQLLEFVDHMERRSAIIPMQYGANYDDLREELKRGAPGIKRQFIRGSGSGNANDKKNTSKRSIEGGTSASKVAPKAKRRKTQYELVSFLSSDLTIDKRIASLGEPFGVSSEKSGNSNHRAQTRSYTRMAAAVSPAPIRAHSTRGVRTSMRLNKNISGEAISDLEGTDSNADSEFLPSDSISSTLPTKIGINIADLLDSTDGDNAVHTPISSTLPIERNQNSRTDELEEKMRHSISVFFSNINLDAIKCPTEDFEHAIETRHKGFSANGLQKREINEICLKVTNSISHAAMAPATALAIPAFWKSMDQMQSYSQITAVETRTIRVRIMSLMLQIHRWITHILNTAFDTTTSQSWAHKLVRDISSIINRHPQLETHFNLDARKYIPGLETSTPYNAKITRALYDIRTQNNAAIMHASSAIQQWLGFPTGQKSIIQASLLESLAQANCGNGVLYLDEVWKLFQKPSIYLGCGSRPAMPLLDSTLAAFRTALLGHPICKSGSSEHAALAHLSSLVLSWQVDVAAPVVQSSMPSPPLILPPVHNVASASTTASAQISEALSIPASTSNVDYPLSLAPSMPSSSSLSQVPASLIAGTEKMKEFVQFIRKLIPLIKGDINEFQSNPSAMLRMVSKKPDYYLPFRQKAPLMVRAMAKIYSDLDRLSTGAGFFNVIAFRATFYLSDWAMTSLQWFNSYDDWNQYSNTFAWDGPAEKEKFFTNDKAYGQPTNKLELKNLEDYWLKRKEWTQHLAQNQTRDVIELYRFFLRFVNVGSLTAMLIVGDLVECKFAPMPTVETWATLVEMVDKGARSELQSLGLVPNGKPAQRRGLAKSAFIHMHQYLIQELTVEECKLIGYNVIMMEHSLCKGGRIFKEL